MKVSHLVFFVCAGIVFAQCEHNPVAPAARELTDLEKRLVESDNKFGFTLFQEIVKAEKDKNVFISPLSVSMALGMTLNGADGETKEAMERTLEFTGMTTEEINQSYKSLIELLTQLDPRVVFDIANSIWHRQEMTFEQAFFDVNKTYFDAVVQGLDFNDPMAVEIINDWVKENTRGKIQGIIDQISSNAVMFLINAIYFKGTWTYEFDKELTQDDVFYLPDGSEKTISMMQQKGDFDYFGNLHLQAVDLPYGDVGYSMTIILPDAETDLDSLILALDQESWQTWTGKFTPRPVQISLPKFKLEYELVLNDVLSALGMGIAFTGAADFTQMYKPGGLAIDEVKHKTFVEVNEEGTEAAAVTSVGIVRTSQPSVIQMRIDRPFLFIIRENHSGTILFMGKIVEPVL